MKRLREKFGPDTPAIFMVVGILVVCIICISIACITMAPSLFEKEEESEETPTFYRLDGELTDSKLELHVAGEVKEIYYNTALSLIEDDPTQELYKVQSVCSSIDELSVGSSDVIDSLKQFAVDSGRFESTTFEKFDDSICLSAIAENKREVYTTTIHIDGTVHAVYRIGWGSPYRTGLDAEELVKNLSYFSGIALKASDLLRLQDEIVSNGTIGGNYTVYVSDKWSYTYFVLSVKGLGTGTEYWESYISVTNKNSTGDVSK